ncbi:MAG: hypothetical protein AAFR47_21085 [Pseudomonadota bacterium]
MTAPTIDFTRRRCQRLIAELGELAAHLERTAELIGQQDGFETQSTILSHNAQLCLGFRCDLAAAWRLGRPIAVRALPKSKCDLIEVMSWAGMKSRELAGLAGQLNASRTRADLAAMHETIVNVHSAVEAADRRHQAGRTEGPQQREVSNG